MLSEKGVINASLSFMFAISQLQATFALMYICSCNV